MSQYNTKEYSDSILGTKKRFVTGCVKIDVTGTVIRVDRWLEEYIFVVKSEGGPIRHIGANSPGLEITDPIK
jgi:hypothetical protein